MTKSGLRDEWRQVLGTQLEGPEMRALGDFLRAELAAGKTIYPPGDRLFAALNATPPTAVRVVIIGQDPYHGPGQAQGLSFSVPRGVPVPPSLRNIFIAIERDLGLMPPRHGDLSSWAEQGVLLLNATLTVEAGRAGSHQNRGWEGFTDSIIAHLNAQPTPLVFLLWGKPAQRKGDSIDRARHCVLTAPHPSPLSAHRGFLDCRHFSQANAFLERHRLPPIDWRLPS